MEGWRKRERGEGGPERGDGEREERDEGVRGEGGWGEREEDADGCWGLPPPGLGLGMAWGPPRAPVLTLTPCTPPVHTHCAHTHCALSPSHGAAPPCPQGHPH